MIRQILWNKDRVLFKEFVENSNLLGWITDPDGYSVYISPAWRNYTGQSAEEAAGYGWITALHSEDQARARKAFFDASDTERYYGVHYRLLSRDGVETRTWAYGTPRYDSSGVFTGYTGLTTLYLDNGAEKPAVPSSPKPTPILTLREREVLSAIAAGHNTLQISAALSLSRRTIETHAQHATLKLGATNKTQACVQALMREEIQFSDIEAFRSTSLPS